MSGDRHNLVLVLADAVLAETRSSTEANQFLISFGSWTALLTHPLYWFIWTYWFPQPHESAALRFSSALLAIPILLRGHWPPGAARLFPLYWHGFIIYCVPTLFTYLALWNNFNEVWLLCHLGMLLLLIILLPTAAMYAAIVVIGTLAGAGLYTLSGGNLGSVAIPGFYIPIVGFVFFFCVGFMHQARLSAAEVVSRTAADRQRSMLSNGLTGTIAHEVRKPVAQSRQSFTMLDSQLTEIEQALRARRPDEALEMVRRAQAVTERGYSGMVRGDMLIGIILRNIREERIDPSDFQVLSIASIVDSALESYAFGRGQRERVRVVQAEDFSVRGEENLLIYVLFNLLQNALVFDAGRPDLAIEVRFGRDGDGDGGWLSVRDNGPGIPAERLPGIFESFMTYANKQGTGLGLPFCKRVMTALGGRIDVRSAPGAGTEFRLRFPPVTASAPRSAAGTVSSRA